MDTLGKTKVTIEGSSVSASVSAFIEYQIIRDVKSRAMLVATCCVNLSNHRALNMSHCYTFAVVEEIFFFKSCMLMDILLLKIYTYN